MFCGSRGRHDHYLPYERNRIEGQRTRTGWRLSLFTEPLGRPFFVITLSLSDRAARQSGLEFLAGMRRHILGHKTNKGGHKGGSGIDQILLSLGHASIQNTERYLGVEQDLMDAPCDHL